MRYIWHHIQFILRDYQGAIPLVHFLKNYFRNHPKLGSRDRKILSEMAYCWFRCSKGLDHTLDFEEKIKTCIFLCDGGLRFTKPFLPSYGQEGPILSSEEKIALLAQQGIKFDLENLLSSNPEFSEGMSRKNWLSSMLRQPALFIRIRNQRPVIEEILLRNDIPFQFLSADCLSLPNTTAVDKLLPEDSYVIQDASSRFTGNFFRPKANEHWWDCCSGAGGKSLLLRDMQPDIRLTVSDKRGSILQNLSGRFRAYHLPVPERLVLDVTDKRALEAHMAGRVFDHILCDVPCSGSGTWARTPEQLFFFRQKSVTEYAGKQKSIAFNVLPFLRKGGRLIYITCSVFKDENEHIIRFLLRDNGLELEEMQLINGIENQADSMFVAVIRKR